MMFDDAGSTGARVPGPKRSMRICLVGPLPPPPGGMANQCEQLARLLQAEGLHVESVRTNAPYRPTMVSKIPVLRALFRLLPYAANLWTAAGRSDVMHVLANSGWAWYLFAAPALVIARIRGLPAIVNYRGGNADSFFANAPRFVLHMIASASMRITPSAFLVKVFERHGLVAQVIPNIIDLSRFTPAPKRTSGEPPTIVVTRNLERIYDIPTAIKAFARVKRAFSDAKLIVAGVGPELPNLRALVDDLALGDSVQFTGRIDNADIPALYASADCMVNPSTVDNMPISILEALACGVPVVTTNAGGIPDMVANEVSALLVPIGDDDAMANRIVAVLQEPVLAARLRREGLKIAKKYGWPRIKELWLDAYSHALTAKAPR